jgi:hypothetical protein
MSDRYLPVYSTSRNNNAARRVVVPAIARGLESDSIASSTAGPANRNRWPRHRAAHEPLRRGSHPCTGSRVISMLTLAQLCVRRPVASPFHVTDRMCDGLVLSLLVYISPTFNPRLSISCPKVDSSRRSVVVIYRPQPSDASPTEEFRMRDHPRRYEDARQTPFSQTYECARSDLLRRARSLVYHSVPRLFRKNGRSSPRR